ncbi:predicted protein [Plenodomus lingam JN3]|uniref:Uncharacterized protein n=1 Tax=Leptosphaeria maculans (strain JN3 / isolate v23.1.3 / race Av1-4-5-6-7-8) TaxID=985895 RepID=E5A5X1_LEPMJ|nr:predicted protein [Plenodomus lingam JN3]CBX99016.1 predicted protein [Plenodomus lingam JN3]
MIIGLIGQKTVCHQLLLFAVAYILRRFQAGATCKLARRARLHLPLISDSEVFQLLLIPTKHLHV